MALGGFAGDFQHVIPDIQENICTSSNRKTLKNVLLHLHNAPAHNSRLYSEMIESAKTQRVPHPLYSPNETPRNFFLFGYLKVKHRGISFSTIDDLIFAISQIFV
jgi:hypothetical protein